MKRTRISHLGAVALALAVLISPLVSSAQAQEVLSVQIQQGRSALGANLGILNFHTMGVSQPNGAGVSTTSTGINLGPLLQHQSSVTSTSVSDGFTFSAFLAALFGGLF